ncbi:MAG TPA: hypothetical protein VHY91_16260 [Pirellulales bacterium]|jgi:gamma-glutamyl phosphate reductase|nr:hypothetical protein [Pirellulales bacterium]
MSTISILDQFLDPLTEALSPEVARRLIELRASAAVQARVDELATKANGGTLSMAEEAEYREFVEAVDIVSIIQSKARRYLAQHASAHGTGTP